MKEGTVTLDINDYDRMMLDSKNVKPVIKLNDNKLTVKFPMLMSYIKEHIAEQYPGFIEEYSWNDLSLSYIKPVSNE